MDEPARQRLGDLRRALLHLHKTLLEWERAAYEKVHGRVTGHELLHVTLTDPQFVWLRPLSELIVRIDELLDRDAPDAPLDPAAVIVQARILVAPHESGNQYAQRYFMALQESPDAVLAHRAVADVLRDVPSPPARPH